MAPQRKQIYALLSCLILAACTTTTELEERPENPLAPQDANQPMAGFSANPLLPGGGGLGAQTMRVTSEEELRRVDNGSDEELIWTDPDNPDAEIPGLTAAFESRRQGNGWLNNLGRGISLARREGRPLIIWFHNSVTSPRSNRLGAHLLDTPKFNVWCQDRIIRVKLDAGASMDEANGDNARYSMRSINALARRYGLSHFPGVVVVDPRGRITARIDGYDGFVGEVEGELKLGVERAEQNYTEFKNELMQRGYREWRSRRGDRLFAKLQRYDEVNQIVYLRDPGGKVSRTRLDRFCREDIAYLDEQAHNARNTRTR